MGYDFHLTPQGPRLIEVNTNAGGALFATLAGHPLPPSAQPSFTLRDSRKLLDTFMVEYRRFSGGRSEPPHIAIIDEKPEEQFLFEEMRTFSHLLSQWGQSCIICDPCELSADERGVFHKGKRIDLVYNRHCDFYLETPPLEGLRRAYLARTVCLTPNPFVYGLLADKRRTILWSDPEKLSSLGVNEKTVSLLRETVPESRLLADFDRDIVWKDRKRWVFKPVDRFGSQGVLVGEKMTRTRFEELDPAQTLVQERIPPSMTPTADGSDVLKTDFRLFAYRDRPLGLAARLYRGQVTNLRTPGGGFAAVRID